MGMGPHVLNKKTDAPTQSSLAKPTALVSAGNFLEMYDFMVFGYYATAIAKAYFPLESEFAGLLLAFMTFGAGYLMRPIGAIVLGAYVDKHGRRKGLMLTLSLMALGTLAIAATPGYTTIGWTAPLLVLVGRLIQGLSAGVEVGGVSVYLAEIAPSTRRGFYVAWQSASQQVAVVFAAALGLTINTVLTHQDVQTWGWRIPFVIGCILVPFLLLMRSRLEETPAFKNQRTYPELGQIARSLAQNSSVIARGTMLATMTTVFFYMVTAYTPTFGSAVLHLSAQASFTVTLCVGVINFALLPLMGAISDRIGRRPILLICAVIAALTAYPVLHWLVGSPDFAKLLLVEIYFATIFASYNGAMVPYLAEIMPPWIRISSFSLAFSLATGLFGGFTPALATVLIHSTGDAAMPGAWLTAAALISLFSIISLRKTDATFRL